MSENKSVQREQMMLYEPLPRVITKMAVPSIIGFLITAVYNLADTFFVSGLGESATAAVSVNASLDQIIMMAGSMLAVGAASYISRLLGARKEERASRVFSVAFFSAMAFGAAVMVLGLSFMGPMVRLLGATDTCEKYAMEYASYVLLAAPFMAANFVMNQCLRAEGSAMLSMIGMGFGGVLNCFLDPFFIFYLDMGVAGASIATAISKLVSFAILIFPYLTRRSLLRPGRRRPRGAHPAPGGDRLPRDDRPGAGGRPLPGRALHHHHQCQRHQRPQGQRETGRTGGQRHRPQPRGRL